MSFYHKLHPLGDAIAPHSRIWRKPGEGVTVTAKGSKIGNNGPAAKFFVAIGYKVGVVLCEKWESEEKFDGFHYKQFIKRHRPSALRASANARNKLVLQDGCPVQGSKQAQIGYNELGCKISLFFGNQ